MTAPNLDPMDKLEHGLSRRSCLDLMNAVWMRVSFGLVRYRSGAVSEDADPAFPIAVGEAPDLDRVNFQPNLRANYFVVVTVICVAIKPSFDCLVNAITRAPGLRIEVSLGTMRTIEVSAPTSISFSPPL